MNPHWIRSQENFLDPHRIRKKTLPIYHRKIVEHFEIHNFFSENIVLELPFGVGFIKIHQLARYLCYFEIFRFSTRVTCKVEICRINCVSLKHKILSGLYKIYCIFTKLNK